MGCGPSKSSQPNPKIVVVGASGYVGKAALQSLTKRHGKEVDIFAGTRDPSSFEAMDGVKAVTTDMGNLEGLTESLKGFDRAFIVVPGREDRAKLAVNALEAAKAAGVTFTLLVSVLTSGTDTIFGRQFKEIEGKAKSLDMPLAIIRLPLFIDNNYLNAESIKEQGTFYDPRDPSKMHTPAAVGDIGKSAADILANPDKHIGKTYNIVSPAYSLNDMAEAFTAALGKPVKPTTVHYNAAKEAFMSKGFPEWQVDGIMELFRLIDDGSDITNQAATGDIEAITGEKATTIQEWVSQNAAGFK